MGVVNKLIKKTPSFLQQAYYNIVPFEKRYGEVYGKTLRSLMESSEWTQEQVEIKQFKEMKR